LLLQPEDVAAAARSSSRRMRDLPQIVSNIHRFS
jgi:hypothetical protein